MPAVAVLGPDAVPLNCAAAGCAKLIVSSSTEKVMVVAIFIIVCSLNDFNFE